MIKIAVSGRTDVQWPELSYAEIRAIVEAAHARGVRVTAHIDRAVALRRAVEGLLQRCTIAPAIPPPGGSVEQDARTLVRGARKEW